ncbi:MAG TPA: hypothetical protein VMU93_10100 [Caulobacteraceae bacterium]|nr:hypothetical protein [Caulobacteraceae bacterium]
MTVVQPRKRWGHPLTYAVVGLLGIILGAGIMTNAPAPPQSSVAVAPTPEQTAAKPVAKAPAIDAETVPSGSSPSPAAPSRDCGESLSWESQPINPALSIDDNKRLLDEEFGSDMDAGNCVKRVIESTPLNLPHDAIVDAAAARCAPLLAEGIAAETQQYGPPPTPVDAMKQARCMAADALHDELRGPTE